MVNQGHECLAVANHAGTSVPNPPPDDFNPPAYPEVAQRNISVLVARTAIPTRLLTVAAGKRTDKASRLTAEQGGQVDQRTLIQLGLGRLARQKKRKSMSGLAASRCVFQRTVHSVDKLWTCAFLADRKLRCTLGFGPPVSQTASIA